MGFLAYASRFQTSISPIGFDCSICVWLCCWLVVLCCGWLWLVVVVVVVVVAVVAVVVVAVVVAVVVVGVVVFDTVFQSSVYVHETWMQLYTMYKSHGPVPVH